MIGITLKNFGIYNPFLVYYIANSGGGVFCHVQAALLPPDAHSRKIRQNNNGGCRRQKIKTHLFPP